jgi:2-methylcitrate dehydratase PrpD
MSKVYEISKTDCASTEFVANWIAGFDSSGAPADVRANVDLVLLDTLGVMIASTRHEVGKCVIRGAAAMSGGGAVIVPGKAAPLDVVSGALVYGTLGHGIELDEVHLPSRQHVGATVGATVLALGQHLDCSMSQLRHALLAGYEVAGHLGIAVDNNILLDRNFHLSGVVSGFGCTAAAARLLGLNGHQVYQALGLTASQASGTLAWHTESHHMSKSFQCGLSARNGVTSGFLAQQGYLGPPAVFGGPCNFFKAFRGTDPAPDWHCRLGKDFEILNSSMKLYAAGRPMHAALDALLDIMKKHSIEAGQIEGMEVRMPPGAARIVDGNYTNSIDCRTVMATAAIDRQFGLDQADDTRMSQPDVQALKQRIRLIHDPALDPFFPHNFPAAVSVRLRDGRVAEERVIAATGERDRPMTVDALQDKFTALAAPVIGADAVKQAIEILLSPKDSSVRKLVRSLNAGP